MEESFPPLDHVEDLFDSLRHSYREGRVPHPGRQSCMSEVSLGILDLDNMQEDSISKFLGTSLSGPMSEGIPHGEGLPSEYLFPTGKPKEPVSSGNSTSASMVPEGEDESSLSLTASTQDPFVHNSIMGRGRSSPASLHSEPHHPMTLPASAGPLQSSSLPSLTRGMGDFPATWLQGRSLSREGVSSRPQGDGEHSNDEEGETADYVSVSPGDSTTSDTPSLGGSTPGEECDITPALSEISSDGASCDAEERLGTEGQEGEPEVVALQPLVGSGEGSDSDEGGSSPSCGDGREGSEEPLRRTGGAGDGVDHLGQPDQASQPSGGAQEGTQAVGGGGFPASVEVPSMAEDALRRGLYEGGQLQSLMDRDSLARSIRPPIMAGQEGVEGGQTIVPPPPSADPASVSSAGTGSPLEDPPVVLPSASTARSSFLSGGSLVHSGHQRPVAVGEKEGEFGGTPPQPGVAKAASEGYFSAAEGSHEVMTVPPLPLGLDPALTQESQLEEGPRHSSSSSMSPLPMAGDVLTVSSGLPEAQNVLEQLAQLHPSWGEEGRESSESMSAISSEGSLNFEDTQQPRFNPFDSELGSRLSGIEFDSNSLISASALLGQLDSEENILKQFQQVEEMGSNSVSWAASFMSARQVQGEGQGEGQDQSNLLKDQSVGAYFIQKSAKLEELELPPSPEGQVFEGVGDGSESDGTPSSFSENDAEDTLVDSAGDGGYLVTDHTLIRDTLTQTLDELRVDANVSSTCSIPITSGTGTTNLTFTLPELRIEPATDDEASSQVGVDSGTQQGEPRSQVGVDSGTQQGEPRSQVGVDSGTQQGGTSSQVGVDSGVQQGGASSQAGRDHGTQQGEAKSQVDVDHGMQQGGVPDEENVSTEKDAVANKRKSVGEKQAESVDKQAEAVNDRQKAAPDTPEEELVGKHEEGASSKDITAGSLSSADLSSEAHQESLEEEPAVSTPVEGSGHEAGEEDIAVSTPPTSFLLSGSSPVDTAAQTDLPQISPTHPPLVSPPTTCQAPTSVPDSTVLVGDVSITTILGDLTLHHDPLLPPEQTPSFAHFTPGLNLTKTGITQHTRQGDSREFPQGSAMRGSMGEYLKPLAGSSSAVTMAMPTVGGSAPRPTVTDLPPVSEGGGAQLPSTPVHQLKGTEVLSATQHDGTRSVDTPLSSPSPIPASHVSGARGVASPPTSSTQLSAFLESLVAKYSPTRETTPIAPPLGDTPYPLQLESSGLSLQPPASSVSLPTDIPSLSRSLQTEFSAVTRLSSSGIHTSTVKWHGSSASDSTGGGSPYGQPLGSNMGRGSPLCQPFGSNVGEGSPLRQPLGSNVGGGSPLSQSPGSNMGGRSPIKQYLGYVGGVSPLRQPLGSNVGGVSPLRQPLGSNVGGLSPLRQPLGSNVGGVSPLRQHLNSSASDQLSSIRNISEKTFSPPVVHISPSKASTQLLIGVPKSLVFPRVCCVGTSLEEKLAVVSHSDRWTESKLTVVEVYHNGEKMSEHSSTVFQVPHQCHLGPGKSDEIKVCFVPEVAGTYEAILSVQSSPLLASKSTSKTNVILKAKAEEAQIKVLSGDGKVLDFGAVQRSSSTTLPLVLSNHGLSDVPLHLTVDTKMAAWHHFSLANIPDEIRRPSTLITSPSSTYLLLPANQALVASLSPLRSPAHPSKSPGGQSSPYKCRSFALTVEFHAPKKVTSDFLPVGPPTEMRAKLLLKVDGFTGRSKTIHEIGLRALVGVARLFAPRSMQSVDVSAVCGHSRSTDIPLKNAGNMALDVALRINPPSDGLTVTPSRLHLAPDTESSVLLIFTAPRQPSSSKHELLMHVEPKGPDYKIHILASARKKAPTGSPVASAGGPLTVGTAEAGKREVKGKVAGEVKGKVAGELLCNSKLVHWGCVREGGKEEKKLVLRNGYPSAVQLKLSVADELNSFQLQSALGTGSSVLTAALEAGEERAVSLTFSPAEKKLHRSSLYIEDVTHQRRHKVPLCGIGGCAQVKVRNSKDSLHGMAVDCGRLFPDRKVAVRVQVVNSGKWAAFVRASCHSLMDGQPLPPSAVTVTPSELVLYPQASEELLLICRFGAESLASSPNSLGCYRLATLTLVWGEELLRQRLKKALARDATCDPTPDLLPYLASYMNQVEVTGDYCSDLGDLHDETSIFMDHLRLTEVSLIAQREPSSSSPSSKQLSSGGLASSRGATSVEAKRNLLSGGKGLSPDRQGQGQRNVEVQTTPPVAARGVAVGRATSSPSALYLPSQTVVFPSINVGRFSDHSFELHNPDSSPIRWFMSSVGPPLVRGTDRPEGDMFKATYAVFWLQELNGTVNPRDSVQVPVTFHPRDPGMYTQMWDVNVHHAASGSRKIRLTLTAQASPCAPPVMEVDPQPLRTPVTAVVYIDREKVKFPTTAVGSEEVKKVRVVNKDYTPHTFTVIKPSLPFSIAHSTFTLRPRQFARLPIYFTPTQPGACFRSILAMKTEEGLQLFARLSGKSS